MIVPPELMYSLLVTVENLDSGDTKFYSSNNLKQNNYKSWMITDSKLGPAATVARYSHPPEFLRLAIKRALTCRNAPGA
jgi:hypothetical protein